MRIVVSILRALEFFFVVSVAKIGVAAIKLPEPTNTLISATAQIVAGAMVMHWVHYKAVNKKVSGRIF